MLAGTEYQVIGKLSTFSRPDAPKGIHVSKGSNSCMILKRANNPIHLQFPIKSSVTTKFYLEQEAQMNLNCFLEHQYYADGSMSVHNMKL